MTYDIKCKIQTKIIEDLSNTRMPFLVPRDCLDIKNNGQNKSGVYTVSPEAVTPIDVWCDMETEGGGWTVSRKVLL